MLSFRVSINKTCDGWFVHGYDAGPPWNMAWLWVGQFHIDIEWT